MRLNITRILLSLAIAAHPLLAQDKGPAAAKAKPAAPAKSSAPPADLAQLMKGIFYPASNVVFAAQDTDPATIKAAPDPSMAVNPLESSYGKWQAVENNALALSEAASLLNVSGRKCANGRDVPIGNADWAKLVEDLREVGLNAYKAAQAKDLDKMIDIAGDLTVACANCHNKYREVRDRCN